MLFKNRYRIESTRLKGYDYSSPGKYFITIITKNRKCFFGHIENEIMILNEIGKIANKYWLEIPQHFNYVILDKYIIMPNHVHGIIFLNDLKITIKRQPIGIIINQYKRACTIDIRKITSEFKWQPRFHNHIIRNERSLNNIRRYIKNNPRNWNKKNN